MPVPVLRKWAPAHKFIIDDETVFICVVYARVDHEWMSLCEKKEERKKRSFLWWDSA
jgi:hypothetical protein